MIPLGHADRLWAGLTADSAVPVFPEPFTHPSACSRAGYVLLGARVVETVQDRGGAWGVRETEVRRAAAELRGVAMDAADLVRIGGPRNIRAEEHPGGLLRHWRRRILRDVQQPRRPEWAAEGDGDRPPHLAGIDWPRVVVERNRGRTEPEWWLPRAVVRLLDEAEHAEAHRLRTTRPGPAGSPAAGLPAPSRPPAAAVPAPSRPPADEPAAPVRPYRGELKGQSYAVLSRKPGTPRSVAGWLCAVCRTVPAAVLDHCHEHGDVRAPVCRSCNTLERPDHLYSTDVRVADRYARLFGSDAVTWLGHWHRCTGCRARTTLPIPHLAAWTAHVACRSLRPSHRPPDGRRRPCGVLRVSWTGSHHAPRSCLFTVSVDFCPSGEHRVLARVPYREAAGRFAAWLAETAPVVAAEAGPDRLDGLPTRFRPVVVDTGGGDQALF